jgi:hypothetical protein
MKRRFFMLAEIDLLDTWPLQPDIPQIQLSANAVEKPGNEDCPEPCLKGQKPKGRPHRKD